MEHRAPGNPSVSLEAAQPKSYLRKGAWVLAAYALSGIGLLAVMAYYFSDYVTH